MYQDACRLVKLATQHICDHYTERRPVFTMECLRLTPVSSRPGDACSRLQEAAAVALRMAANSDELLARLLHHGRNLVKLIQIHFWLWLLIPSISLLTNNCYVYILNLIKVLDNTDIQQPDAAAEAHFFLPNANLKEPAEKMVNVHRPLSDLHHEMDDSYPVCSVMPSQSITDKVSLYCIIY